MYLLVWRAVFAAVPPSERREFGRRLVVLQLLLAVAMALGAFYQYFVDLTLLGINPSELYSGASRVGWSITKRATSFIGSPQNLGAYCGLALALALTPVLSRRVQLFIAALVFGAGALSGGGAFVAFCLGIALVVAGSRHFGVLALVIVSAVGIFQAAPGLRERLKDSAVRDLLSVEPTERYEESYQPHLIHETPGGYLWGRGLAMTDRLTEVVLGGHVPAAFKPGVESDLLKIFQELGGIGLAAFLTLYAVAWRRTRRLAASDVVASRAVLLGLATNLAFTPSFNGLTYSSVAWAFVLWPLFSGAPRRSHSAHHMAPQRDTRPIAGPSLCAPCAGYRT